MVECLKHPEEKISQLGYKIGNFMPKLLVKGEGKNKDISAMQNLHGSILLSMCTTKQGRERQDSKKAEVPT